MLQTKLFRYILIFIIIVAATFCVLFIFLRENNPASAESPNIILISVGSLQASHLGAYGYSRTTSPNIDKFASESVVFENAFTPATCTTPSYASLFTGLYPQKHESFSKPLENRFTTMAETLQQNGYKTAGFVSAQILSDIYSGLAQGFDTYDGVDQADTRDNRSNTYGSGELTTDFQRAERTTEETVNWLAQNDKKKFFLFAQYNDPHYPYGESAPFTDKFVQGNKDNPLKDPDLQTIAKDSNNSSPEDLAYLSDKYDENIAYADFYIGKLLDEIRARGLYDNSLIIVTSNHGESFDHNYLTSCWRVYDSTIKIPLIIHDPAQKQNDQKRVKDPVTLLDIYPTILSRVKLAAAATLDGLDLGPTLKGESLNRDGVFSISNSFGESGQAKPMAMSNPEDKFLKRNTFVGQLYAYASGNTRVILNGNSGKKEIYDISTDPGQTDNLVDSANPKYLDKLLAWIENNPLPDVFLKSNQKVFEEDRLLGIIENKF